MSDTPSGTPPTEPLPPVGPAVDAPDLPTAPVSNPTGATTEFTREPTAPDKGAASGLRRALEHGPQARLWRITSIVLLILGCVLAPLGLTASWAKNLVTDQTAYLEAVGPLATNPVVIDAAQNKAVAAIDDAITNLNLADKLGDELTNLGLPPKLASLAVGFAPLLRAQITDVITTVVHKVLTSEEFVSAWQKANAEAHKAFVGVMTGENTEQISGVSVKLGSLIGTIKGKLAANGVTWASQIPDVPVQFDIANNADVKKIQGYYDLLNTLGTLLPWLAIVFLLASIVIAPSRIKGLFRVAVWLAVSMVVLAIGLSIGRSYVVSAAPSQPEVTKALAAQLTVNLRATIRAILIASIVIAAVAWIYSPWKSATALRAWLRSLTGRVQDSRWRLGIQIAAGVIAVVLVLILVSLDDPSLWVALLLGVIAALAAVVAASALRRGPTAAVTGPPEVQETVDAP
ncbi:MAG TPA: hypothetical protein VES60_03965 [Nakamurella sp.]|nr:hypothetical protein [Nakamurella sp.]